MHAANRNDGWRGYFQNTRLTEQGIVDIATCRMPLKQGHRTIIRGLLDGNRRDDSRQSPFDTCRVDCQSLTTLSTITPIHYHDNT